MNKIRIIPEAHLSWIFFFAVAISFCYCPLFVSALENSDPLPSWNEGKAKEAILEFVRATTTEGSSDYVPSSERIATFDQDGTLWVEKPIYSQFVFALDRIKALAPEHPEWKTEEPFASLFSPDQGAIEKLTLQDIEKIIAATHSGMTVEQFDQSIQDWLKMAKHPRFDKLYTQIVYEPMLEVLRYMRSHGYQTYIVTGGGQDFVREYSEKIYGIPPQEIIGSAGLTKYTYAADGSSELIKLPKILLVDDKAGKPSAINLMIGRRPYAAFGNSIGDQQMLEWTQSGKGKRLMMLVSHDDAVREYSYGPESKIGTFSDELKTEAKQRGWVVVSMKNDWKTIFP